MALTIEDIGKLFRDHGHIAYEGDGVSQAEHALQAAELAENADAGAELVTAALLHDLGHLLNRQGKTPTMRGIDDQHQYVAIPFLRGVFPASVLEAIRLHVEAKRALCALEPDYYERLSEDSKRSLTLQGGVFTQAQVQEFLARPHSDDALKVRRWDDAAKAAGARTRPLSHYLDIAERCTII